MPSADVPLAAALLRSARAEAGLTQEQLATAAGLSVRTVRGLESGRVTNPHRHSIEAVLGVLALDPAAARHLRSQFAASRPLASFTELVRGGADVDTLLGDEAARAQSQFVDISVLEKTVIGPDRRQLRNENTVAISALQDGLAGRVVLWGGDPKQDLSRVRVDHLHNCRERGSTILPRPHLIAVELAFDTPLAKGSTHVYSYHWNVADSYDGPRAPDDPGSLSAVHGFRRPLHSYVLEVHFEGCPVPERIWQVEGPAEDRRIVTPLSVSADNSAHIAYRGLTPGVYGIAWEWDDSAS